MANRQALIVFVTDAPPAQEQVRSLIEGAVAPLGFRPGPWAINTQQANFARVEGSVSSPYDYRVTDGPWADLVVTFDQPTAPPNTFRANITAYRQNFLDGPADVLIGGAARAALQPLGVRWTKSANRTPQTAISWDRGIPAAIVLEAEGASTPRPSAPASSNLGLAVAGLAIVAGLYFYAQDKSPQRSRA